MVIVAGTVEVEPAERETYLAGLVERMQTTRAEPGCLEYAYSGDPADPRRVLCIERWASQADFEVHVAVAKSRPQSILPEVKPKKATAFLYQVTGELQIVG